MCQVRKIGILPGHKWLRMYRLQYKVTVTEANRLRLQTGKKLLGRPVPRLVSIVDEDAWMIPRDWNLQSVLQFAKDEPIPYFACYLDGHYYALDQTSEVLWCLKKKRVAILPMEEI